jgi:acetyl-CoA/propionyl-CoA carboxylase, biotin carboxylase, biotin carboxyl carrier protein
MTTRFDTVLVANRGEIAVRVIRSLRALGLRSVAVFSDPDALSRHVVEADLAVRIGPAAARESYLCIEAILAAAHSAGAGAIHPGYGFLSENAEFAEACVAAGVTLIGPPASAMRLMGDKIAAKSAAMAAGVPVVPGRFEDAMTDEALAAAASEVGFPVLIKPSAGGGGKGMRLVHRAEDMADELVSARRESVSAFGDDTLFIERFVTRPRHIEVQVFADTHGTVVHLGERECSLQRRHQKIIEEAPSVLLDPATRERIGASAVALAAAVGYVGAGTVEFIVSADRPDEFFFMEMNTRLQVEHPVTEMVTGVDLVAEQIRVAAGLPLSFSGEDVRLTGHAIEARVYAEDPAAGFLPTGGEVRWLQEPSGQHVRVDSGVSIGSEIGSWYDPMMAKVIAWGPDRSAALATLQQALSDTVVLGVQTNLGFLQRLLAAADVSSGQLDTELVERELTDLVEREPITDEVLAAYALVRLLSLHREGDLRDPWQVPSGWRLGTPRPLLLRVEVDGRPVEVRLAGSLHSAEVQVGEGEPRPVGARILEAHRLSVHYAGITQAWSYAEVHEAVWLHRDGATWMLQEAPRVVRERGQTSGAAEIRSPMPGVVIAVRVAPGAEVVSGQPLVVVEAMKMEHAVTALSAGTVSGVLVAVGDQVTLGQHLATVEEAAPT